MGTPVDYVPIAHPRDDLNFTFFYNFILSNFQTPLPVICVYRVRCTLFKGVTQNSSTIEVTTRASRYTLLTFLQFTKYKH